MRRSVLIVLVVSIVCLAGCLGGIDSTENASPETDAGEDIDDEEANETTAVEGDLEIHHIDVGQADATLVIEPGGETMLIDTGDWRNDGEDVISYLEAHDIDRIDHLVATHAHADHIGGHAAVITHFAENADGIGVAYDSGVATTTQTYERYLDAVENHDVTLLEVQEGDSLSFGGAAVEFYNPPADESSTDLHYNSIALTLTFGDITYLTTGDAETAAEQRMVDTHGEALEADIYHAGHHGSSTSSTPPFLDTVDPEVSIISSSLESQYGHPHDEVLEAFGDRGIETYWTGVHGDIVVTTDGSTYDITPATDGPTDGHGLLEEKPTDDDQSMLEPSSFVAAAPISTP